jgi:hypothetical protein
VSLGLIQATRERICTESNENSSCVRVTGQVDLPHREVVRPDWGMGACACVRDGLRVCERRTARERYRQTDRQTDRGEGERGRETGCSAVSLTRTHTHRTRGGPTGAWAASARSAAAPTRPVRAAAEREAGGVRGGGGGSDYCTYGMDAVTDVIQGISSRFAS